MAKVLKEEIESINALSSLVYIMTVKSGHIASCSLPGQFVNVRCCEGINVLLRRPISICGADGNNGTFEIAFRVKGTGTGLLAKMEPGMKIDLVGPLGTPFDTDPRYGRIAVIGGGIGVFPLLYLLRNSTAAKKDAFLGFRNREAVVLQREFAGAADRIYLSTDDGSAGYGGLVTDLFEKMLDEGKYDIVYACGPEPMMKRTVDAASSHGILCQVSLEQRMGCGLGACLVCACKTRDGDGWRYSRVCKDGPVFWGNEVIFDREGV